MCIRDRSQTSFKRGISGSIGKLNTTDANKLMMINDINIAKVDILPTNFILTLDKFNWCKFNKKKKILMKNVQQNNNRLQLFRQKL